MLRRAARIILNALTIVSLLLCLAAVGSWVRAGVYADEHADQISYHTGLALHVLSLTPVGVDYYHRWDDLDHPVLRTGSNPLPWTRGWWYSRLYVGGGGNHFSFYRDDETFEVGLPYWPLVLAGACLPSMWMVGWRRRRSRMTRPGHYCPSCGYDLRATPDRCPECGTAVVSKAGPPSEGLSETEGV